jgi:hypothetical protein
MVTFRAICFIHGSVGCMVIPDLRLSALKLDEK